MDQRNYARIGTVILFLILSVYFVWHPIFGKSDISRHEGETIPIYFFEVAGKSGDGYIVREGIGRHEIEVVTDAQLEIGNIVSFYCIVKDNRLIAQKHHLHTHPNTRIYLSIFGLVTFMALMRKEED